jgi:NTE family protein
MFESFFSHAKRLNFRVNRRSILLTAASGAIAAITPDGALGQATQPIKRSLALGGGSIKGAYEAGAIRVLLNKGFVPDRLYGISVGSLNAAFLCDRAYFLGKPKSFYFSELGETPPTDAGDLNALVNWPFIGEQLVSFWIQKVTDPSQLVKEWPETNVGIRVLFSEFNGVMGVEPLKRLVSNTLSSDRLSKSNTPAEIGAVNIDTGKIKFVSSNDSDFKTFVLASAAVPLVLPIVEIQAGANKGRYVDGGAKHIVPAKEAADGHATHIICIVCQAPVRENNYQPVKSTKNILQLLTRLTDIASDNVIANDIREAYQNKKDASQMKVAIIRPDMSLETEIQKLDLEINNFDGKDIKNLISRGEYYADLQITKGTELTADFFK